MKTKFILLLISVCLITANGLSQMKIGANSAPNTNSVLELVSPSNNQGFVLPSVSLTGPALTNTAPLTSTLVTPTMVYNTNSSFGSGIGIYYWDGTQWNFVATASSLPNGWLLVGNTGTTASTAPVGSTANNNFIGTTDSKDLVFASNDLERMRIMSGGNIGVGTKTPDASAILQMYSTTQGLSFPSMTTTNRNAISTPLAGLTIYNTTTGCLEFYVGGNWQPIGCGCTTKPATPSSIAVSPSGTICSGTSVSYSISDVSTATSYTWVYSGSIGTGGAFTGQGTTQINVNYGSSPTAGNWTVTATNACGTSTAATTAISLTPVPSTPGTITQSPSGTICPSQAGITYTVAAVTNATSYNWTVPSGATITSNSGTSITVTWGAVTGSVTVTAAGCNGTSAASSLAVSFPAAPATPGTITATPSTYCPGATVTYSISSVTNATTYTWTYPSDATYVSGQGTTSLTITEGSTLQNVTVTAGDCGGNSAASTLSVNPGHGSQTFTYTGSAQTFTVPACVTSVTCQLWGAGGGGGDLGNGASGAYMTGTLAVTSGSALTIVVGQGGQVGTAASYGGGGGGGYGLEGAGGGRSAIIVSGADVVTAGGGGGGGYTYNNASPYGGAGGAPDGGNGGYSKTTITTSAGGGGKTSTLTAGIAGVGNSALYNGTAGSQYIGGAGNGYLGAFPGGGGGGGYYGGGGGAGGSTSGYCGGGGGGSSYPASSNATFTITTNTAGNIATTGSFTNVNAPYTGTNYISGVGQGGNYTPVNGGNGEVVLTW
jgi:hypothetical protein